MNSSVTANNTLISFKGVDTFLQILVVFISLISIAAITLLGLIFYKNRDLFKCVVCHFIVNIIVVDVLKSLINVPILIYILEILRTDVNTKGYIISKIILCNLNAYLTILFETIQLFLFVSISFERLRCVRLPLLSVFERVKLTKKLLLTTWSIAFILSVAIFMAITTKASYENLGFEENKCYIDYFHIFMDKNTMLEVDYIQNVIYDAYHFIITSIAVILAIFFYTKINLFLKKHHSKMVIKKSKLNQKKESKTFEVSINTKTKIEITQIEG